MADVGLYLASHAILPAHSALSIYVVCGICVTGRGEFWDMSLQLSLDMKSTYLQLADTVTLREIPKHHLPLFA